MRSTLLPPLALLSLAACEAAPPPAPPPIAVAPPSAPPSAAPPLAAPPSAAPPATLRLTVAPIALPGATGSVSLDYLAIDRAAGRVWIPAGETGSVDVLDAATGKLTRIEGFLTAERESHGVKRVLGPSSATIGEGFVYVGNRGSAEVCPVDAAQLTRGACLTLPFPPDGLQYVAATREVWATTPRDRSITVIDAGAPGKLAIKARIALPGAPEGYAVDQARGVFYTNLEDGNETLVLDARERRVIATWQPRCGADGPRGLALDAAKGLLFVACTDHVQVLDAAHGGAALSQLPTGAGVDNIDYLEARGQLYVVSGKTATLTVAHLDEKGALTVLGTAPTAPGTRVVVAGSDGAAYVADGQQGRVLVVTPAR
jgi:DNA-binding beta-propeller fold protein YncE